jgi:hypothetical protein
MKHTAFTHFLRLIPRLNGCQFAKYKLIKLKALMKKRMKLTLPEGDGKLLNVPSSEF